MQPYFFPYLTYYQMAAFVDEFVFLDDVSFFRRGFLTRNRVLRDGQAQVISAPVEKASQNRPIMEHSYSKAWIQIIDKLKDYYRTAPFLEETLGLVESAFGLGEGVAYVNAYSVTKVLEMVGVPGRFYFASELEVPGRGQERIINICKSRGADAYVNLPGGRSLYEASCFAAQGIQLCFIDGKFPDYPQRSLRFEPGLSMIDVLMWNEVSVVRDMVMNNFDIEECEVS